MLSTICELSVIMYATAMRMLLMPRVPMNESTLSLTTTSEFTRPMTSPIRSEPTAATTTPWWFVSAQAVKQTETVSVPAIVRSNAPAATGRMRPRATMALIAWKVSTCLKVLTCRKRSGIHSAKTRTSSAHT